MVSFHAFYSSTPKNNKEIVIQNSSRELLVESKKSESLPGPSLLVLGAKINLNQATQQDLEALPGVGPKLAEKIVKNRQKEGPFRKIEDLMRVPGIKEKKLQKLRNYIEVR